MFNLTRAKRWLAIVVDDGFLGVIEATGEVAAPSVTRHGRFPLPPATSLESLNGIAHAFASFLNEHGFESRRAFFGLPARYFLLHNYEMPRVDEETTSLAVWHHATTVISPEVGPVALDYVADTTDAAQQTLAIVGIQERLLGSLRQFCDAAGIEAIGVTATILALAAMSEQAGPATLVVYKQSVATEMTVQIDGVPRMLRHICAATASTVQSELRRAAARLSSIASAKQALVVWDRGSGGAVDNRVLSDAAGLLLAEPLRQWLRVQGSDAESTSEKMPDLIELALLDYATHPDRAKINLIRPRLKSPVARSVTRRFTIAAACASFAVLLGLMALVDIHLLQKSVAASQSQLDAIDPEVRAAKPLLQRMQYAAAFQSEQPRYLNCLRDLTLAVAQTNAITLNHFDLNGSMQGSCSGEAMVQQDAVDFVDRLSATRRFGRMNCKLDSHASTGKSEGVSFHIAFQYVAHS